MLVCRHPAGSQVLQQVTPLTRIPLMPYALPSPPHNAVLALSCIVCNAVGASVRAGGLTGPTQHGRRLFAAPEAAPKTGLWAGFMDSEPGMPTQLQAATVPTGLWAQNMMVGPAGTIGPIGTPYTGAYPTKMATAPTMGFNSPMDNMDQGLLFNNGGINTASVPTGSAPSFTNSFPANQAQMLQAQQAQFATMAQMMQAQQQQQLLQMQQMQQQQQQQLVQQMQQQQFAAPQQQVSQDQQQVQPQQPSNVQSLPQQQMVQLQQQQPQQSLQQSQQKLKQQARKLAEPATPEAPESPAPTKSTSTPSSPKPTSQPATPSKTVGSSATSTPEGTSNAEGSTDGASNTSSKPKSVATRKKAAAIKKLPGAAAVIFTEADMLNSPKALAVGEAEPVPVPPLSPEESSAPKVDAAMLIGHTWKLHP